MLTFKPTQEDLDLRRRTHARLVEARVSMGMYHLLHPANALQKKPASAYP